MPGSLRDTKLGVVYLYGCTGAIRNNLKGDPTFNDPYDWAPELGANWCIEPCWPRGELFEFNR